MNIVLTLLVAALVLSTTLWIVARIDALARAQDEVPELVRRMIDDADPASAADLHGGFTQQIDRTRDAMAHLGDRVSDVLATRLDVVQRSVGDELKYSRTLLEEMKLAQQDALADVKRTLSESLSRELKETAAVLKGEVNELAKATDGRLQQISGKVEERLDEGFRKTNETFVNVMARLSCIDEAQKKIDGLATNVVGLKEILGDKRARGAFGEVQLEGLVHDLLPANAYAMQHGLSTGVRVDCALFLPEPMGLVSVDSKFPLESYKKMTDPKAADGDRRMAERQFVADVKRHIEDIASKYLIPGETCDGAVMFVPAESVFAEIHDRHPELVTLAGSKRVWIASPTTLMAILTTARAVLKDVETRKQVHIIKDNLGRLGKEFERFDERMRKLAEHIRLAQKDAEDVHVTSKKISEKFRQIEGVELPPEALPAAERALLGSGPTSGTA